MFANLTRFSRNTQVSIPVDNQRENSRVHGLGNLDGRKALLYTERAHSRLGPKVLLIYTVKIFNVGELNELQWKYQSFHSRW